MCPAIFRLTCRFIGSNSNSWFRLYPVSSTKTFSAERCRPAPYNCGECSTLYRPNTLIKTQHFHQDEHGYRQPQVPTPKVMKQQRHARLCTKHAIMSFSQRRKQNRQVKCERCVHPSNRMFLSTKTNELHKQRRSHKRTN